jgi:site-specific recombinase XerD
MSEMDLTIDDLIDSYTVYLEINCNFARGTVEAYNQTAIRLSGWLKEKRRIHILKDVSSNDLQLFLGTLRHPKTTDTLDIKNKRHPKAGKVFEATTRARIIASLKNFFKWAVKNHHIETDISQILEIPKIAERIPKSLSLQDAMKFLDVAATRKIKDRDLLICIFFLLLGMRVSELVSIDAVDINEDDGTIKIIGKGNKERQLSLTPKMIRAIDAYVPVRQDILKRRNRIDEPALFVSEKLGQRLKRRSVELIIEQIALEAGVRANNLKVSPHKLRHTCATVLYNEGKGADLLAIAELLGHADPKSSAIYTKVNKEKLRSVVASNPLESI